jgi:glycosidase
MDPNADGDHTDGIDGWRLDVAEMVAIPFWKEFRTWVREINPEAYIAGEVWWEDWKNDKMFNAAPWLGGDVFDAVMNYRWAREVIRFFAGKKTKIAAGEFDRRLKSLRDDYRPQVNYVLMNLLDSHDTDRLGSMIVNRDLGYDHNVGLNDNRDYDVRKPDSIELRTQKLIALFQMTYVGAPMIYYGDESGMWGGDDPDERKPMLWADLKYDNESHHPFGTPRPADKNEFNAGLHDYYRKLIGIRGAHKILSLGDFVPLVTDDQNDVYVFLRLYGGEYVIVFINASSSVQTVTVPLEKTLQPFGWVNLLDSTTHGSDGGVLRVRVEPESGAILEACRK